MSAQSGRTLGGWLRQPDAVQGEHRDVWRPRVPGLSRRHGRNASIGPADRHGRDGATGEEHEARGIGLRGGEWVGCVRRESWRGVHHAAAGRGVTATAAGSGQRHDRARRRQGRGLAVPCHQCASGEHGVKGHQDEKEPALHTSVKCEVACELSTHASKYTGLDAAGSMRGDTHAQMRCPPSDPRPCRRSGRWA